MIRFAIALGVTLLLLTGPDSTTAAGRELGGVVTDEPRAPKVRPSPPLPLHVVKNQILDSRNQPVRLRGVNTASLEWTSNGEGHILDTVKTAVTDWHVNHIRLPLAQDRWFGKAPEQTDGGKSYRARSTKSSTTAPGTDVTSCWICTGRTPASGASRSDST